MRWSVIGYAMVGIGQLTFATDDVLNGNVDLGMLLNLASGAGMLAAAWAFARAESSGSWRALVIALTSVGLVRVVDLAGSLGDAIDLQFLAFVVIVVGALVSALGAWREAPTLLRIGAALGALGALGYLLVALTGARETLLWALAALVDAAGWTAAAIALGRDAA